MHQKVEIYWLFGKIGHIAPWHGCCSVNGEHKGITDHGRTTVAKTQRVITSKGKVSASIRRCIEQGVVTFSVGV